MIYSIDQNSHPLWDTPAKLLALAEAGRPATHFVEDIDVAFTALGTHPGDELAVERERFHASGGQDWGAALFYSEFLGRLPLELRDLEPVIGMKVSALARQTGRDLDELYEEFSPGDNFQLIGPSYVGDRKHHRVIGDLSVSETADHLRLLMDLAQRDLRGSFPGRKARTRIGRWLAPQRRLLDDLLDEFSAGRLVDLYAAWMRETLGPDAGLDLTSSLFHIEGDRSPDGFALLQAFLTDYDRLAGLYNQALAETASALRPLKTDAGELPFFATLEHDGHLVRSAMRLLGPKLKIADLEFDRTSSGDFDPKALAEAGVRCIAGKAVVLVIQVRTGPRAGPLALPYQGSLYVPAAHRFAELLAENDLLPSPLAPVLRVRLHLLDRMAEVDTTVRLPDYLAEATGSEEMPASRLAEIHPDLMAEAAGRLDRLADDEFRTHWQRETFPQLARRIDGLDARRRELGRSDPKGQEIRDLSHEVRRLEHELLDRTFRHIVRDYHVAHMDYWDSRGAIWPWCVALGGSSFYRRVLASAEIYEESAAHASDRRPARE